MEMRLKLVKSADKILLNDRNKQLESWRLRNEKRNEDIVKLIM